MSKEGEAMARHLELGSWGEDRAAEFLSLKKGWKIIERNVRLKRGEIDIVAINGKELVLVEVRTRTLGKILPPEATVGPQKMKKLIRAGEEYVIGNSWKGPWRIDLLAITLGKDGSREMEHFPDITHGEYRP